MRNLTENELALIKNEYKKNLKSFLVGGIWAIAFLIASFTIPVQLFSRNARNADMSGTLISQGGIGIAIVFIAFAGILIYNYVSSPFLKYYDDLTNKKKVISRIPVSHLEEMSEEDKVFWKERDKNYTHRLYFKSNSFNVKKQNFSADANPELLEAKEMLIHIAEHSEIKLKTEII